MSIDFINKIAPLAIKDYKTSKVLPSLTIAQAILESAWGKSGLTLKANNLFGIKGSYNGQSIVMPTQEYSGGNWITINATFRKYPSWLESIQDHSNLLTNYSRYAKVVGEKDYKKACTEVWKAGYATDPNYPKKLIDLIERYSLNQYDNKDTDDVKGHWAENDIKNVINLGLMVGRKDGFFPDDGITRAELAVIINRLINLLNK